MILNMKPRSVANNTANLSAPYAISLAQFLTAYSSCGLGADLLHNLRSQFGTPMPFTARPGFWAQARGVLIAKLSASFGMHIGVVIRSCTQPEVRRVNAQSHIAGVANQHSFRDRTMGQLVGEAVRPCHMALTDTESPVPIRHFTGLPYPAVARSINLRPKALDNVFGSCGRGILGVHIDLQSMCRATAVSAVRGFVMPNYTTYAGAI